MAILRLSLRQSYKGNELINYFDYVTSGSGPTAPSEALVRAFGCVPEGDPLELPEDTAFWFMRGLQHPDCEYRTAESWNIYDDTDFFSISYAAGEATGRGTGIGAAGPPFVTIRFRSQRFRRGRNRAYKRIGGVGEGSYGDGGTIDPVFLVNRVGPFQTALGAPLTYSEGANDWTFTGVVIYKQRVEIPPEEGGGVRYEYYPTEAEQEANLGEGVEWGVYDTVGSQVSRQYGRGN